MAFVSVSGEKIHYERSGGEGPSLVLVHGSGGSVSHWPSALRRSLRWDVIAVDLPGHGRSGGVGRSSVSEYADVISKTAEAMGLSDAAVAGHSLGGAVALVLGLRQPAWLSRLVLVGTGARLRVSPDILDQIHTDFSAAVEKIGRWAFGADPEPAGLEAFCREIHETGPEVLYGDYFACDRFDVMDRVDRIHLPCLILAANQDRLTPPKYGCYLRDNIPGAELAVIEGAGHMMALEKKAVFIERLFRFLLQNR